MQTSDVYECKHCASPYGKPHDPDCVRAGLSPTHDDVPNDTVMDWYRPFHQMPPAQRDIIRHVWSQGAKFGRGRRWPKWVFFLIGLWFGIAWSLVVMHNMGILAKLWK